MKLRSLLVLALALQAGLAHAEPPHVVAPTPVVSLPRMVRPAPASPHVAPAPSTHAAPPSAHATAAPIQEVHLPPRIPAVKTIIFDWDGTIGDTYTQLKYVVSRAFKDIGVTPMPSKPGEDPYRAIIDAQGLDDMCKRGLPGATPEQIKQWSARFNYHSRTAPDELVVMKPGARAELDALKQRYPNTKFAVLSARPQEVLEKMIKLTGTTDLFEVVVGTADSAIAPKPAPDGIKVILERLNVRPKEALMVGDHENDILAGKAAGTRTVALRDGMGHAAALEATKPDFVLDHLDLTGKVFYLPAKPVEAHP